MRCLVEVAIDQYIGSKQLREIDAIDVAMRSGAALCN